jgi:copper chaperone
MKTQKFKTNINCNSCLFAVKPFLDKVKYIQGWEVDINDPDKTLTVKGDNVEKENVLEMVQMAGYQAEEKPGLMDKLFG